MKIGNCYDYRGQKQKAVDAFDTAIRDYPGGKALPTRTTARALALRDLRQPDKAREAFEYVVKNISRQSRSGPFRSRRSID